MHATTVFAHVHADTCIQKLENNVDAFCALHFRNLTLPGDMGVGGGEGGVLQGLPKLPVRFTIRRFWTAAESGSATLLWGHTCPAKSGVAAALCHRSPRRLSSPYGWWPKRAWNGSAWKTTTTARDCRTRKACSTAASSPTSACPPLYF